MTKKSKTKENVIMEEQVNEIMAGNKEENDI